MNPDNNAAPVTTSGGKPFHASVAEIVHYLSATTDDVYELMATDGDDEPMIYYFDSDSDSHVFVEWADEKGWLMSWQCSPGMPTSAKLLISDPGDPVKVAQTIAAVRSGEDEFEGVAA